MSPKLFTLVLENVFKKLDWQVNGINIDGVRLNHLRFADDIVVIASTGEELKNMLRELNRAWIQSGLKTNLNDKKIISTEDIQVTVNDQPLEVVSEYIYLGHKKSSEITRRIGISWAAFGRLGFILKSREFPINLKRKVFDDCVMPVLTYGLETMAITRKFDNKLQSTQ